jgi:hypothetical protein
MSVVQHRGQLEVTAGALAGRAQPNAHAVDDLIGRLGARLGSEAVMRLHPADSHVPAKAAKVLMAAWSVAHDGPWPAPSAPRPLVMFRPEPVEAPETPEPPATFRWRTPARSPSAIPCPPPMHMVISAVRPPVRSSSCSAFTTRIAPSRRPDGRAQWPRHWGSPGRVEIQRAADGKGLGGEGLVRFHHVEDCALIPSFLAQAPALPGSGQCPSLSGQRRHGHSP